MNEQMSREEVIKKALEIHKRNLQEQEKKKGSQGASAREYEDLAYCALSLDRGTVVRLLGNPVEIQNKAVPRDPGDPKVFFYSMILGDDGKKFRCIFPDHAENPEWFLWKVHDLVTKSHWDKATKKRVHDFEFEYPDLFFRVRKNNRDHKLENGWYPSRTIAWNVIDRSDTDWHVQNNHTKLLSKKMSPMDEGRAFYEPGVPQITYNNLIEGLVEHYGDYENYDVVIYKQKSSPWYILKHGIYHAMEIGQDEKQFIVDGGLTEAERAYKRYDLDNLYKITSYSKIKSRLGAFIKRVDSAFNTNFYDEIVHLADEEQKQWDEQENPQETTQPPAETQPSTGMVSVEAPVPQEQENIDWEGLANGTFNGKEYLGVPKMTEEEKSQVLKVNHDGSFQYVETYQGKPVQVLKNRQNGFVSPATFHVCPLSGDEWE